MFKKILKKSVALLCLLVGMQQAYSDQTIHFYFIYGSGVNSIGFDHSNNVSVPDVKKVSTNSISASKGNPAQYEITVTAPIGDGNVTATNNFNQNFASTAIMADGTSSDTQAKNLDFYIQGKSLTINGITVSNEFIVAHENYSATRPGNWWVSSSNSVGTTVSSFNDGSVALELTDSSGQNVFCLNQYGTGTTYQLIVSAGKCSNVGYIAYQFGFVYKDGVNSVTFEPTSSESGGVLSKIYSGNKLTITAQPLNSAIIADSFVGSVSPQVTCSTAGFGTKLVSHFLVYQQGWVCGPDPQKLDFWVTGYMKINGNYVVDSYNHRQVFIFAEGQDSGQGRWWAGVFKGPGYLSDFYSYWPGGVASNNRVNVQTNDGNWHTYEIASDSKDSFTVKSN